MKQCLPALTIPARIYSNDCAHYREFDASSWFAVASPQSLLRLAATGWGGESVATELAKYEMERDDEVATILQYVMFLRHGGMHAGYQCHVDPVSALEWLAYIRPEVLAMIRQREKPAQ